MDRESTVARLGSFVLSIALVLAVSLAIAWPLWFFATKARNAFTIAVALGAALLLALRIVAGFRRRRKVKRSSR